MYRNNLLILIFGILAFVARIHSMKTPIPDTNIINQNQSPAILISQEGPIDASPRIEYRDWLEARRRVERRNYKILICIQATGITITLGYIIYAFATYNDTPKR